MKYLIDENCKISKIDKRLLDCDIVNSTEMFKSGERDEVLTLRAKIEGWVIVTSDIRMALRSLKDEVGVIFIDNEVMYMTVEKHGIEEFKEMYDYLHSRFIE